jgi:hypothetical protein
LTSLDERVDPLFVRTKKIVVAQQLFIEYVFWWPGAPRPSAPHPKIDRPPREKPRRTTFRALEVEHYEATMFPGQ